MEWFFEGLGTSIITLLIGLVSGGSIGYRIGVNKNNTAIQKQNAGDNATQVQVGRDHNVR